MTDCKQELVDLKKLYIQEKKAHRKAYIEQKKAIKRKFAEDPEIIRERERERELKRLERMQARERAREERDRQREERRLARCERRRQSLERTASMPRQYTLGEEIFNSVSHGIGAGLSVAAIALLVVRAAFCAPEGHKAIYIVSFAIFGVSLLVLYLMSTLYHALTPYDAKNVFGIFDHSSIYILIAGTYTPIVLTCLPKALGWTYFGVVWGLAVFGVTMYAVLGSRIRKISAITYVPMGLLIVPVARQLSENLNSGSLMCMAIGGVLYLVGWPFYMLKKKKWMHCIFHLFVLAASVFHFFGVYYSI